MRYRLIAGTINHYEPEDGWQNVHLDVSPRPVWWAGLDVGVLPDLVLDIADEDRVREALRGEMFDEARLHHVLEHMDRRRGQAALGNLWWLLKPGGTLDVEVPDFLRVVRAWLDEELDHPGLEQWLYGEQLAEHEPGDSHRAAWTEPLLRAALEDAYFDVGDREETGHALRFIATRSDAA